MSFNGAIKGMGSSFKDVFKSFWTLNTNESYDSLDEIPDIDMFLKNGDNDAAKLLETERGINKQFANNKAKKNRAAIAAKTPVKSSKSKERDRANTISKDR